MKLPPELIKRFVDATTPPKDQNGGTVVFGTAKVIGNDVSVHLDGASNEIFTPVEFSANVSDGDRVRVQLKDRKATILGNLSPNGNEPPGYQQLVNNVSNHISNETIHLSEEDIASIAKVSSAISTIDEALFDSSINPNLITSGIVKELRAYILGLVYPIGSVYAAFGTGLDTPDILIGGTWEEILSHDPDDGTPVWHVWRKTSNDGSGGEGGGSTYGGLEFIEQDDIDRICV